jgi:hypothetical protein
MHSSWWSILGGVESFRDSLTLEEGLATHTHSHTREIENVFICR